MPSTDVSDRGRPFAFGFARSAAINASRSYPVIVVMRRSPNVGRTWTRSATSYPSIIRHVKRGSERWQHRSERQQRLLALLPGFVLMIVTVIMLDVPW
ncbi:hypothetical protein [Amnibacterium kyonggiense]|uniref:hypothetical protein n=1 Tax=Amnibacterium kyonggiense TaxID=595671 RepID=UPI00105D4EAC|nr:hypothetical protein [Amnibacterium kyonggiense]